MLFLDSWEESHLAIKKGQSVKTYNLFYMCFLISYIKLIKNAGITPELILCIILFKVVIVFMLYGKWWNFGIELSPCHIFAFYWIVKWNISAIHYENISMNDPVLFIHTLSISLTAVYYELSYKTGHTIMYLWRADDSNECKSN